MAELLEGPVAIAHLLRRAGFGADPEQWSALSEKPYDEVLDQLLAGLDAPPPPDPAKFDPYQLGTIQQVWLERMVKGTHPLAEKLAMFWHGHFATSEAKIADPVLMWRQYQLFRSKGAGSFRELVLGVSRDVAMIRWLDGNSNRKGHANENYGRELQELFTLGIGNYTEQDIREIARAFTGWGSRHHDFVFRPHFHDDGEKTIHGKTGTFGGEDVVRILTELPQCAEFISEKLIHFFSHPDPTKAELAVVSQAFTESGGDIKATLAALFRAPYFRSARSFRRLVRSPVEFCVGALRATGVKTVPPWIHGALDRMGQILFRPPSVKGWTSGDGWLSSGGVVERLRLAQRIPALMPKDSKLDVAAIALAGPVPAVLATALERADPRMRNTIVLGCPEFQLA
jgi:uncharacterized protein (DUF1800 family)